MSATDNFDVLIVGGFGHVGLPLGIVLADTGLNVALYDTNTALRPTIEAGTMPFIEYDAETILPKVIGKTLHVTDDIADVARSKVIIITIGTPVDEYLSPKTRLLFELAENLLPHLSDQCILMRSTVFPGTSEALNDFFHRHGKHVHLSFCPERIVQGYAVRELRELPQIVSGFSPEAVNQSRTLFEKLGVECIEIAPEEAELSKLYLNAWRYIQFAAGNQFYMTSKERGLDYNRIYDAMTYKYPRGAGIPKPGFAAGPCLLKDTMQLASANRNHFNLGHTAMMINEGLPAFVVQGLLEEVDSLKEKTVGVLGMAFKADIDDVRDSLSFKLKKKLEFHGAHVLCSDEYVDDPTYVSKEDLVTQSDVVIVGVPHSAYKELNVPDGKHIVDLWGIL